MKRQVKVKSAFRKAHEILSRGIITEWEIRMLRKNIRYSFCKNQSDEVNLSYSERYCLLDMFMDITLDLTKEQQRKGIQWLRNTHFRKNGAQRKTSKLTSQHLYVIRNFSHFTFEGLTYDAINERTINTTPVYRTHAKNGSYFDYIVDPSWFGAKVEYRDVEHGDEHEMTLVKGGAK